MVLVFGDLTPTVLVAVDATWAAETKMENRNCCCVGGKQHFEAGDAEDTVDGRVEKAFERPTVDSGGEWDVDPALHSAVGVSSHGQSLTMILHSFFLSLLFVFSFVETQQKTNNG